MRTGPARRICLVIVWFAGCSGDDGSSRSTAVGESSTSTGVSAAAAAAAAAAKDKDDPIDTAAALGTLQELLAPGTFGDGELIVAVRRCPLGDPDELFGRIADELGDDDVSRTVREGRLDSSLFSLGSDITLATCTMAVDPSTPDIAFVRLEARGADQPVEPLMNLTHDPATVELMMGPSYRGGDFYRYCGDLPDSEWTSCTVGWRDDAVDLSIKFTGSEARLVDLQRVEQTLAGILDDIVVSLAG